MASNDARRPQALRHGQSMLTSFRRIGEHLFFGFVVDPANLKRKFAVEILADGYSVNVVRADQPARELTQERVGDGCYGFVVSLRADLLRDCACVEARLANLGSFVGAPIFLDEGDEAEAIGVGEVEWLGGVRFSGWIENVSDPAPIRVEVDGLLVDQIRCASWRHLGSAENARPVRGFDFHISHRFADGLVHHLVALTGRGQTLEGCPVSFLAYPPNLRSLEINRASSGCASPSADRSIAASVPFSHYQFWRQEHLSKDGAMLPIQIAVLMVGGGETNDTLESLREQTHRDWTAISLAPGSERPAMSFERGELGDCLRREGAECDVVVCALAGSLFASGALQRIAEAFSSAPEAMVVYGDFELQGTDGSLWPIALPAFDYERMLEQGYCAHLFAMRRALFERCLAAGSSSLYRLFNAALDQDLSQGQAIVHLPGALATLPRIDARAAASALQEASKLHLQARDTKASCVQTSGALFPAVRTFRTASSSRVTIAILARNRVDLLKDCLASLSPVIARASAEILVIDNDASSDECRVFFDDLKRRRIRVIHESGPFNYSDLMNQAARAATGEALCLLDGDMAALDENWLEEMMGRLGGPDVGAVGPLLISSSGVVEHGGVVLGPNFAPAFAFTDRLSSDAGYADLLRVAHECSAISSSCMLVCRRDFLAVGGMDPVHFPVSFGAIDLCLKLRAKGRRIIFTPHAKLKRISAKGRNAGRAALGEALFGRELRLLRAKWGNSLAADPYYNPILALDSIPYSGLAWPARSFEPRTNVTPTENAVLSGF